MIITSLHLALRLLYWFYYYF